MRARYKFLCDHSIRTALSAIEIYNKPDFKDREQIFAILIVIAWESLLKAKILKENNNRFTSLYVKKDYFYKRKQNGDYWTIGIAEAIRRCQLSPIVQENIQRLVDVRDAAVHLTAESPTLPYLVFTLGTAALRNYSRLVREWFDIGLNDYNFYILPLGFAYPFQTISAADLRKEPQNIAVIISQVAQAQAEDRVQDDEFYLLCELKTTLISAKKITADTDLTATVKTDGKGTIIVPREVNILDKYPYTWTQVWKRIKSEVPGVKQSQFTRFIRDNDIKGNPKYSRYNFRSKLSEKKGPSKLTPVVYNEDFVRFASEVLSTKKRRRRRAKPH